MNHYKKNCLILIGTPGSGKNTFSRHLLKQNFDVEVCMVPSINSSMIQIDDLSEQMLQFLTGRSYHSITVFLVVKMVDDNTAPLRDAKTLTKRILQFSKNTNLYVILTFSGVGPDSYPVNFFKNLTSQYEKFTLSEIKEKWLKHRSEHFQDLSYKKIINFEFFNDDEVVEGMRFIGELGLPEGKAVLVKPTIVIENYTPVSTNLPRKIVENDRKTQILSVGGGIVCGGVIGGVVGSVLIPVPVVGSVVGGTLGGAAGALVGGFVGKKFGGDVGGDKQSEFENIS